MRSCAFPPLSILRRTWFTLVPVRSSVLAALFSGMLAFEPGLQTRSVTDFEKLPFAPRQSVCYRTSSPLDVDGKLSEAAWRNASWSDLFVDIDGGRRPLLATRVKMLWDDRYFYIGAELEEPDIWATLTKRDSVIFQDPDFEVFIDPDGDTHAYYELEINALGTVWDLMLIQPYRDGGPAVHAWDIAGLRSAVDVRGTINKPGDRDEAWTVEVAMPWEILREAAPNKSAPRPGDQWRVNFSRVEWHVDPIDGKYVKRRDSKGSKPLPEENWVWSPQGAVNMHMPERWGFVQFAGENAGAGTAAFVENPNERVKWALRRLYYRQRQFRASNGRYAADLAALNASDVLVAGLDFAPSLQSTDSLYQISAKGFAGATVHIRQDGRVWITP
jgi:cellulose/xylan binding protein with CBM9 domain